MPTTGKEQESLIGPTAVIRGDVRTRQEQLTIMGKVTGSIDHDQVLTIHRGGAVDAVIRAREVIVEGSVDGDIHASSRVTIAPTGRVNGDVYAQLFSVEEGAVIKGSVIMDANAETIEELFRSNLDARRASRTRDGVATEVDSVATEVDIAAIETDIVVTETNAEPGPRAALNQNQQADSTHGVKDDAKAAAQRHD